MKACIKCVSCSLQPTPPHNINITAYNCSELDVWIEKVKYLGGGQSDMREDVNTFYCAHFEERKADALE